MSVNIDMGVSERHVHTTDKMDQPEIDDLVFIRHWECERRTKR